MIGSAERDVCAVILRVDGVGCDGGKLSSRLQDADRDLTAVGDKQAGYWAGWRWCHAGGLQRVQD